MTLLETIFLWIGTNFTTEIYMLYTKLQGTLWSIADIVLVFVLLKIAGMVRKKTKKKEIVFRYLFLWFSAILTPVLIFTQTSRQFFLFESLVCGIQFLIIVYTVIPERRLMMNFIGEILTDNQG